MPVSSDLPVPMRALLAGARRKEPALLDLIQQLVRAESPSDNKAAVDACVGPGRRPRQSSRRPRQAAPPARLWRSCSRRASAQSPSRRAAEPILLLGHLDTVWPLGTLEDHALPPGRRPPLGPGHAGHEGRRGHGLHRHRDAGRGRPAQPRNRAAAQQRRGGRQPRLAAHHRAPRRGVRAVYVLEPAQGLAYKTARKGTGNWRIDVTGVAAHAGVDFEKGASAIRELARVVETVSGWTDLKRGLTVSVGVAGGGTKTNVIPAQAWAEVDVRIARKADGPRIERKFAALKAGGQALHAHRHRRHQPPAHGAHPRNRAALTARRRRWPPSSALRSTRPRPAAPPTATSPPLSAFPRSTAWARWAKARTPPRVDILVEHLAPRTALLAGLLAL